MEKVCIYIYTTQSSLLLCFSAHSLFPLLLFNHAIQLTSAAKFKMTPSINSVQPNNRKTIENDCLGKNRALTFISKARKTTTTTSVPPSSLLPPPVREEKVFGCFVDYRKNIKRCTGVTYILGSVFREMYEVAVISGLTFSLRNGVFTAKDSEQFAIKF